MRADPPAELVELLAGLRLATEEQVRGVYPRTTRLAGDLPLFSSVWVDALAQARVLTPFQAAEINAGRGKQLAVGPYVIRSPVWSLGYADSFRAREIQSRRTVDLLVAKLPSARHADCLRQTEELIKRLKSISTQQTMAAASAGREGDHIWIASPSIDAMPLRELLLNKGRFTGDAVLAIARQIAAALAELEAAQV